jgi:hypothetical protein
VDKANVKSDSQISRDPPTVSIALRDLLPGMMFYFTGHDNRSPGVVCSFVIGKYESASKRPVKTYDVIFLTTDDGKSFIEVVRDFYETDRFFGSPWSRVK